MAIIKKTRDKKCWWGWGGKGTLSHCRLECTAIVENNMWFLKKLSELPDDSAIPLLDAYPKEIRSKSQRAICTSMFIVALFTVANIWKQATYPLMDEWIKMWWMYNGILFSQEKKRRSWHLQQHGWTWRTWYEWNKPDRERQILYDITYMWNFLLKKSSS